MPAPPMRSVAMTATTTSRGSCWRSQAPARASNLLVAERLLEEELLLALVGGERAGGGARRLLAAHARERAAEHGVAEARPDEAPAAHVARVVLDPHDRRERVGVERSLEGLLVERV